MTSDDDALEKKLHDPNAAPVPLTFKFMEDITCNFSTESVLGRGGFGVVYKGVLKSGKFVAAKKLLEISLNHEAFQNEVSYLTGITHQNVVQLLGYCAESRWELIEHPSGSGKHIMAELPERWICFELISNKSLDKHITDTTMDLQWNMRYEIIKGICNGLHYLHEECHIIHLDLKPENILMDTNMTPKIADFGLSRIFGEELSHLVTNNKAGTRGYMAPEYIIHGIVSKKADIFSLGVIMIEIITGRRDIPYNLPDSPKSIAASCQRFIEEVLGTWRNKFESTSKHISMEQSILQVKQCIVIAIKCIYPKREKRPTTNDIIQKLATTDQVDESLDTSGFCWEWGSDYDKEAHVRSRSRYEPAAAVARICALRWIPYAVAVSAARALVGASHEDLRLRLQKPRDYLRTFLDGADLMPRPFATRDRFTEEDVYVCTDRPPLAAALRAVSHALDYVAASHACHNACDYYYDVVRDLMGLLVDGEGVVVNQAAFEAKFSLQWVPE